MHRLFQSIGKWFWARLTTKELWSGLIPTAILIYILINGLAQTSEQIQLLREQTSYVREPVILLRTISDPRIDRPFRSRIFIGNVGNEAVENVDIHFRLFLVTEKEIYSYGRHPMGDVYSTDTTRTAREMIFPRLTIQPDEEYELTDRVYPIFVQPFRIIPDSGSVMFEELHHIRSLFRGEYILFVEYSYRRSSDLLLYADTGYYHLELPFRSLANLQEEIGGAKIIERLNQYMQAGPELSIAIYRDRYEVYKNELGSWFSVYNVIPRQHKQ